MVVPGFALGENETFPAKLAFRSCIIGIRRSVIKMYVTAMMISAMILAAIGILPYQCCAE